MEHHPGPRRNHAAIRKGIKWWTNNCDGIRNLRLTLPLASGLKVGILAAQELRMTEENHHNMGQTALKDFGYIYKHTPGKQVTHRREAEAREHLGVGLFMHRSLHSIDAGHIRTEEAQAVFAWVNGVLCGSVYVGHGNTCDFWPELVAKISSLRQDTRWMLIGDWNKTPDENPILEMLAGMGARVHTNHEPTSLRTGGRCIDYAISNFGMEELETSSESHSDHAIV